MSEKESVGESDRAGNSPVTPRSELVYDEKFEKRLL
jgi:hypothetical protein